jgi:hypothetical protein
MVSVFRPLLITLSLPSNSYQSHTRIQPGGTSCRFVARRPCVASLLCLALACAFSNPGLYATVSTHGGIFWLSLLQSNHHTPIQHAVFFQYTEQLATPDGSCRAWFKGSTTYYHHRPGLLVVYIYIGPVCLVEIWFYADTYTDLL